MERTASPARPTVDQLRHIASNYPIIDNHAHNLILPSHSETIPFETIATEAQGRALRDTFKSLSHLRAARQLRQLFEVGEDADWDDVLEQRVEWLRSNSERLHQRCFEGVHALLIDDGLAGPEKGYPYDYHDHYTKAPSKRIVRIETVAERLMENLVMDASEDDLGRGKFLQETWVNFTDDFEGEIQEAIEDDNVAGFKSVICYRTGLDIEPEYEQAAKAVGHHFERYVKNCIRKRSYRIEKKHLNDYLVLRTLEILSDRLPRSDSLAKPFQLHTGLGDNDIKLLESNPAFLQSLIENYPQVPFVLLHLSYPYTREAGYLATVYRHVYLDIGEVFPMISRDGQKAVLRQALELVPGSKLMYSSNGRWFPEAYWLANTQFREVWFELLMEYIEKGDLTPYQAIGMTKDILFNNSNVLYDLRYEAVFDETVQAAPKQLTYNSKPDALSPSRSPIATPGLNAPLFNQPGPSATPAPRSVSPYSQPTFPPPPKVPQVYDTQRFDKFKEENPNVKFIYIQWLEYMAKIRSRIVSIKEFTRMVHDGSRIGISQHNTGTLQNNTVTPDVNATEQIYIEPDLRSLRLTDNKDPLPAATVLSYWRSENGSALPGDPRHSLETLVNDLQYNHATSLLIGFEIEVVFLSRNSDMASTDPYSPLTGKYIHGGTFNPEQWLRKPFVSEILIALEETGIDIEQLHAENGNGQYNFILPPQPPLSAMDTLIHARQLIARVAALHGLRATLHPQPFEGVTTAAHARISLHPADRHKQFFVGGVLRHLPAICAFTLPEEESYKSVHDGDDTNRPSRRTQPPLSPTPSDWEFRPLDGLANPYLALCAILAAGLLGLAANENEEPAGVDAVTRLVPRSVGEAVDALRRDGDLREALPRELVQGYLRMKDAEREMLDRMGERERRVFLIERY
ncbi:extracellular developmental signal biosynthesis protein FluG [Decorospora gaudefroyi]|uniref:Extracellular developmental signal biosynthesis protein FluG n=1 Tax=Decorospora gaudefroyi TaxID=184978 RepID=A0A6A5KTX4_9PLEO|nr:extracellular developmental signal biosynthesis protein FluG [Decorospora gaudefroyi]